MLENNPATAITDLSEHHGSRFGDTASVFGQMFSPAVAPPLFVSDDDCAALAANMIEPTDDPPKGDPFNNFALPAGYTYFGQFVDHDLTADDTPISTVLKPSQITDDRTPILDLDSLYDSGPFRSSRAQFQGAKFVIGSSNGNDDLPRDSHGAALIGELRNDENLIVSQLHLALMKFHNRVVDTLRSDNRGGGEGAIFIQARTTVLHHYQWLVLNDWVARLVGGELIDAGREEISRIRAGRRLLQHDGTFLMPIEFSAAAYRLGHSMVRFNYLLNDASLKLDPPEREIFDITGKDRDLQGRRPLPADASIEWKHFFPLDAPDDRTADTPASPQASMRLDTSISRGLGMMPATVPGLVGAQGEFINLAFRNLKRGVTRGLPSGQAVAKAMGLPPLSPVEFFEPVRNSGAGTAYIAPDTINTDWTARLENATPLWYYILFEAQKNGGFGRPGTALGPVGRRIVVESFLAFLEADPSSVLHTSWNPTGDRFGVPTNPSRYELGHLVAFATGQTIGDGSPMAKLKSGTA